ncbi:MAG TPA: ABC transporter substrate-binding protein [Thermoplasmata archaeon]|nr:ABC transporter substrate-binding protein [Thermoplasmata archaeon]
MSLIPGPAPASPAGVPLTWVVVIVLVVAGAGVALTAAFISPSPAAAPGSVTVTDDLGRTVTVPFEPSRVVVLGPSIVDLLFHLGLRSHIVGVDCYAAADGGLADDYSPDQVALWNLSSSMCVQVSPEFVPSMLANLTPSLVLAATIVSTAAVEEISSELGVPVVMLQPPTLSGVLVDASLVGEIFGAQARAASLNGQLSSELYNSTNVTDGATELPTVLLTYSADAAGYWTFGPATFGESLLTITGARSISANATTSYPELSAAQVLAAQPDWIVYGTGFGLTESSYAAGPSWSEFAAVHDGNVTGIDSNWLTEADPTMILDGIPALLDVFHPA